MNPNKSQEAQLSDTDDDPWGKRYQESVPPFRGDKEMETEEIDKSRMKDLAQIHACEIEMITKNPDVLGYNIDSKFIVWPERRKMVADFRRGDEKSLAERFGVSEERILEAVKEENSKADSLDDTLANLPEGTKFRINPHAPQSAFSVVNSEPIVDKNGEKRYHIDDVVMVQVKKIKAKAGDSDLTVVMNQIWKYKDGNGKERLTSDIPKDASDYIALCKSFVEQSGYSEQAGRGLVLELGNECNMSHESNGPLFKTEAFAETVDTEAYADLYFETAKALKVSFPDIKLSLTGTAFYDYDFTRQVVDQIQTKKTADESLKETKLIDVISFHPYRHTVEGPAPFISNGRTLSEPEVRERSMEYWESLGDEKKNTIKQTVLDNLTEREKIMAARLSSEEIESSVAYKAYANFDHQLESLRGIAGQVGAEVTVGEISFYAEDQEWGESIDENEQEQNAAYGRERGYTSLLWPGEQIVKYESPEKRKISEAGGYNE